jgi:hypothetical protein
LDLDSSIIAVFSWIDEVMLQPTDGHNQWQHGLQPRLADSEVLTEKWCDYLGQEYETALFAYLRRHYAHFFPRVCRVHRIIFVRQAANLWRIKERLWQWLLRPVPHDSQFAILNGLPLPA